MNRYVLVGWPESQAFIGRPDCYFCQCNDENGKELTGMERLEKYDKKD